MIRQVPWSDAAHAQISRVGEETARLLRAEVERGRSMLWHCQSDKAEAFAVTRVDDNPREFVICAFAGTPGCSGEFLEVFREAAHAQRLSIRVHVISRELARLWCRFGLRESEWILRDDLNG